MQRIFEFSFFAVLGTFVVLSASNTLYSADFPVMQFVPEMEVFWEGFDTPRLLESASLAVDTVEDFLRCWEKCAEELPSKTDAKSVREISRWAKTQMASYTLPENFGKGAKFSQVSFSKDKRKILFSQDIQDGIPLPSHSPIVFRRLLFGAVFDLETRKIERVLITIRGWVEE